jgi:hypothetical protein
MALENSGDMFVFQVLHFIRSVTELSSAVEQDGMHHTNVSTMLHSQTLNLVIGLLSRTQVSEASFFRIVISGDLVL